MKRIKYERLIWIITAVGIVLTVILPFILTRTWGLITFEESSAQVGDTIGGITAPVVGIVSILLLALTLREQIKFNRKQIKFNQMQRAVNDYGMLITLSEQIEKASRSIEIRISGKQNGFKEIYKGIENISKLPSEGDDFVVENDDLEDLYLQMIHLVRLCLFLNNILPKFHLDSEIEKNVAESINYSVDKSKDFLELFSKEKIKNRGTEKLDNEDINDDSNECNDDDSNECNNGESDGFSNEVYTEKSIFERYKKETDELLKQLDKIGSRL